MNSFFLPDTLNKNLKSEEFEFFELLHDGKCLNCQAACAYEDFTRRLFPLVFQRFEAKTYCEPWGQVLDVSDLIRYIPIGELKTMEKQLHGFDKFSFHSDIRKVNFDYY
jgi:hypothetical protein